MLDELHLGDKSPWLKYVCAACGAEPVIEVDALKLGSGGGGADIINLPPCPCGTQTFLNRTWDSHPEADDQHRRAINSLAEYLKDAGKSANPEVAKAHQAEVKAKRSPPLQLQDDAALTTDILGRRKLAEQRQREHEAGLAVMAEREAEIEAREAEATEVNLQLMDRLRRSAAAASINKREGRPPGTEPAPDELAAELAKNVSEFALPDPPVDPTKEERA